MVKAYFDYVQSHVFGLSNTNRVKPIAVDGCLWLACGELVLKLSAKSGEVLDKLSSDRKAYVSCITHYRDSFADIMAVGYEDGDIALFSIKDEIERIDDDRYTVFSEHSAAVTCIAFNKNGSLMISGGQENTVILWDVVGRLVKHKFAGHSGSISSLNFIEYFQDSAEYILSSSKDGCLRVWDIDSRRCLDVMPSKKNEIVGLVQVEGLKFVRNALFLAFTNSEECVFYETIVTKGDDKTPTRYLLEKARFARTQYSSVVDCEVSDGLILAVNDDKGIEVIKMRAKTEVANKFKRKKKRVMDKTGEKEPEEEFENKDEYMNTVSNWFEVLKTFKLKHKVNSVKFLPKTATGPHMIAILYNNNTFEFKQLLVSEEGASLKEFASFENLAHQSVVRSLSFSADDTMLVSASSECVKLWTSLMNFQNVRTVLISDVISTCYLPFQKYVCLGTRRGDLALLNADTGAIEHLIEKAHNDTVWSIDFAVEEGYLTVATCSSDCLVKFWSLAERQKSKTMCLEVIRSVQIGEALQWVKFSNSGRHYSVALMDNSMQVLLSKKDPLFRYRQVVCESVRPQDASALSGLLNRRYFDSERFQRQVHQALGY